MEAYFVKCCSHNHSSKTQHFERHTTFSFLYSHKSFWNQRDFEIWISNPFLLQFSSSQSLVSLLFSLRTVTLACSCSSAVEPSFLLLTQIIFAFIVVDFYEHRKTMWWLTLHLLLLRHYHFSLLLYSTILIVGFYLFILEIGRKSGVGKIVSCPSFPLLCHFHFLLSSYSMIFYFWVCYFRNRKEGVIHDFGLMFFILGIKTTEWCG